MGAVKSRGLLFILITIIVLVVIEARIVDNDKVWQKRAQEAEKSTREAYRPDPHKVVHQFNNHVHEAVGNSTRRALAKYTGPCMATNPIDQCWRCHSDWEENRFRLADCAIGFGSKATGGKGGKIYVVNDSSDSDLVSPIPGTLRHAVIQPEPLWIIFGHSMIIRLSEELIMTSDKTIDGRGVNVHIAGGASFMLQFVKNIIIHGLHIHDIKPGQGGIIRDSVGHCGQRSKSDGDGVSIFGSSNIWVDHLSMWNCYDGLVDAVAHSTAITISNCHFTRHNEAMLFGASDSDSGDSTMQITVAFNHFGKGLVQRLPRARWGFVHVVNNDYTHWQMFAIGGSAQPTFISQGNRFIAPPNRFAKEVTKRDDAPESVWKNWLWKSEGDLLLNGAFFVQSGNPAQTYVKNDLISPKPGSFVGQLTRFAGALNCKKGSPC